MFPQGRAGRRIDPLRIAAEEAFPERDQLRAGIDRVAGGLDQMLDAHVDGERNGSTLDDGGFDDGHGGGVSAQEG